MRTRSAPTDMYRHRRSTLQQGQAALLVLAFVVGQVGSYVHAAIERHTVCPEHGEIVHAPGHDLERGLPGHDQSEIGLARGQVEAPRDALDRLRDGSAAGDEHAHEHCYLCPAAREPLTSQPSSDVIAAAMPRVLPFALPAVAAASGRARYVIAPKTSPPV